MLPLSPARVKELFSQGLEAEKSGRLADALTIFSQIAQAQPKLAEAQFHLGRLHGAAGDRAKAEAALRKALKLRPRERAVWVALAQVLHGGKLNKLHREARAAGIALDSEPEIAPLLAQIARGHALKKAEAAALALVKQHPEAYNPALALGLARLAQGKWGGAYGPLQKAVERRPDEAGAKAALGRAALELGKWAEAGALLAGSDLSRPDTVRAYARFLRETCQPEEAAQLLKEAVAVHPKLAPLWVDYGDALAALRRVDPALRAYDHALACGAPAQLLNQLARNLSLEGEGEAALAVMDRLAAQFPGDGDVLTHRAQMRQTVGDMAGADDDLRAAIEASDDAGEAFRAYFAGKKPAADDPLLPKLETRLGNLALPRASRRSMFFALAKAREDLKDYGQVFAPLHSANRLFRAEFPYAFEADLEEARRLTACFEALAARDLPGAEGSDAAIFVSGLPRSGTTLAETILAAHPDVVAGGEMLFLGRALNLPIDLAKGDQAAIGEEFATAGARYLQASKRRTGAEKRFTDKAISVFSRVGLALLALPEARVIMLKRDPRDVGLSIYRNMFPPGKQLFSSDLRDIGRYIRLYDALLAHWQAVLPGRIHVVDYEALTAEPEPHIRALVAAAGLEWNDACLTPHKAERRVETLSFAQVRQPIYRGSVAAWRRYEAELAPLFEALEAPIDL